MLKFDSELFLQLVGKEVIAKRVEIEQVVDSISAKEFKNIFLIGAGGK